MRKVFGGRGVATETKSASAACDICSAPVAAEALASIMRCRLVTCWMIRDFFVLRDIIMKEKKWI